MSFSQGEVEDDGLSSVAALANVLTVHNVLASATLSCASRLDLDKCCIALGNSYYNPSEFPALRVDVRGKRSAVFTISLFESGRIQSTGGCRPVEAKRAMMKIGRRLNSKLNYGITFQSFEIQNVLAVYDACCPVNLGHFVSKFSGSVDYEPDRFPAARVRIPIPPKAETEVQAEEASDQTEQRAVQKIRKLMMGPNESGLADIFTTGAVGSYLISAKAKRPLTGKVKEDKAVKNESVTANVFSTGKITFTGAKSIGSLNFALKILKPALGIPTGSMPFPIRSLYQNLMGSSEHSVVPVNNLNPNLQAQISRLQQLQIQEQRFETFNQQIFKSNHQGFMYNNSGFPAMHEELIVPPAITNFMTSSTLIPSVQQSSSQGYPIPQNAFSMRRLEIEHRTP